MLGKLKIRCIYNENGCQQILSLDNLQNHEKNCSFNFCDKCLCKRSVDHDCIKSLLESKQELVESNDKLVKEIKLASDKFEVLSYSSDLMIRIYVSNYNLTNFDS